MQCPKCRHEQAESRESCELCGLVFARFRPEGMPRPPRSPAEPEVGSDALPGRTLLLGAGLGVLAYLLPFTRFLLSYLVVLVHELGHAAFGWLFGYPSIPAFDFMYGGGVTMHDARQIPIVVIVLGLIAFLAWRLRSNRLGCALAASAGVIYGLLAFTSAHEVVVLFMGHGTELVFCALFLQRGLSGSACRLPVERPLYVMVAVFLWIHDLAFASALATSESARADYGAAKGGGHWMDFDRIARDVLDVELAAVAAFFFFACVAAPMAGWLFARRRERILDLAESLLELRPSS